MRHGPTSSALALRPSVNDGRKGGKCLPTESEDTMSDTTTTEYDTDAEYFARCVACAEPIDYCQGHGPIGDPCGWEILAAHDDDDHTRCHPSACDDAHVSADGVALDDDLAALYRSHDPHAGTFDTLTDGAS